jgi:AcrR family transcriptional regulator
MQNSYPHSTIIKEKIIEATISLIEGSDGLLENITIRNIASKAGVATGLIGYHFGSKKNLIEVCVQRMISEVMKNFSEFDKDADTIEDTEYRKSDISISTINIFDYLTHNPEISKISMLGDLSEPASDSNSAVSLRAIYNSIPDSEPEEIRKIKAFMLLATIQSAFLNRDVSTELLGFDLTKKKDFSKFFLCAANILNL